MASDLQASAAGWVSVPYLLADTLVFLKSEMNVSPGSDKLSTLRCHICENGVGNKIFVAREMILGLRDEFEYLECGQCGILQIVEVPADLERFYGPGYYSFSAPHRVPNPRRWLKRRLAAHLLGHRSLVGRILAAYLAAPKEVEWVRRAGLDLDAEILDVGAGRGQVLLRLRDLGFERLLGIDPFLAEDLAYAGGVRVLKRTLEEVEGRFDLVMFQHSLEHVPDPAATLVAARDRLEPGGCILIRTPIASESWKIYGRDWVELDAPRHLHVFTEKGLGTLARRLGLRLIQVSYDTTSFELSGSELYARNIPMCDRLQNAFTAEELRGFNVRAHELNQSGCAGRAAFWLRADSDARS